MTELAPYAFSEHLDEHKLRRGFVREDFFSRRQGQKTGRKGRRP